MEQLFGLTDDWWTPWRDYPRWLVLLVLGVVLTLLLIFLGRALKWMLYGMLFVFGCALLWWVAERLGG